MSYGVLPTSLTKNRYLINYQGVWKYYDTWSLMPDWDDEVTDVIWLKSPSMVASWWRMRDGKKIRRKEQQVVTDEELTMIMLQVQYV